MQYDYIYRIGCGWHLVCISRVALASTEATEHTVAVKMKNQVLCPQAWWAHVTSSHHSGSKKYGTLSSLWECQVQI